MASSASKTATKSVKKKSTKQKKTLAGLIEEAAELLQKLVRLEESDDNGYGKCVSCGKVLHWKQRQGGHFISRSRLATKLDRRNVNSQCYGCNGFGMKYDTEVKITYERYIDDTYGKGTVDDLLRLSHETVKYLRADIEDMIVELKEKIKVELSRIS